MEDASQPNSVGKAQAQQEPLGEGASNSWARERLMQD